MQVLIVHAHHEEQSFSSALARQAASTLVDLGHQVTVSDLYSMKWDPVSDRRNFKSVADATYLKQGVEEHHASESGGFSAEVEAEIARLEAADLLIFSFPLWWYGMPAILKGWVDKVFAGGRIFDYRQGRVFETGLGQGRKRAMFLTTTGGGAEAYGGAGVQPSIEKLAAPLHHIFWFNGFKALEPFVAYAPDRITLGEREHALVELDARLRRLDEEPLLHLPPVADFQGFQGLDSYKRFMVLLGRRKPLDERGLALMGAEQARTRALRQEGKLLSLFIANPEAQPWHGVMVFRERTAVEVQAHVDSLPLAEYLTAEISELAVF